MVERARRALNNSPVLILFARFCAQEDRPTHDGKHHVISRDPAVAVGPTSWTGAGRLVPLAHVPTELRAPELPHRCRVFEKLAGGRGPAWVCT